MTFSPNSMAPSMNKVTTESQHDAELHHFEPLRVVLAVGALLLALVLMLP